jgi:hypothetical protein
MACVITGTTILFDSSTSNKTMKSQLDLEILVPAKTDVECEYLAGKSCKAVIKGEGKKAREKGCSRRPKNLCCYLCDDKQSCGISCGFLGELGEQSEKVIERPEKESVEQARGRGFWKTVKDKFTIPKVDVWIKTQSTEVQTGDELKGEVCFIPHEEFDLEKLSICLSCSETVKRMRRVHNEKTGRTEEKEYENHEELCSVNADILGPTHISPSSMSPCYPFAFRIPSVARATYHSVDRTVEWSLRPTMKFRGRQNKIIRSSEIFVAKKRESREPATKEIVKEVVLIPCSYCGSLMPQTSIFCPNCGARRKA